MVVTALHLFDLLTKYEAERASLFRSFLYTDNMEG